MIRKRLAALGLVFGLFVLFAIPAMANILTEATATANCKGYSLTVNAKDLAKGKSYTIKYTFTVTANGTSTKFPGTITFTATGSTATKTASGTWSLTADSTATGSATLTSSGSTVPIIINGSSTATLNCAVPPCLLSQLGPAGSFAILGLQDSRLQLSSGPLQVNGNVGIGAYGLFQFSGGAHLNGTLYYDPTASVQISGGSSFNNGQVRESFTVIDNAAAALSENVASLTPTQTFSQIQNNTTITGNGGQNVISVTGNFHLSGGNNLVISGGPNDTFYINVYEGLQLDGGANIALSGVSPSQVLFNFTGTQQLQTSGNANTAGIYLGTNPDQQVQINGGVHNSAFIFASNNFSFQSNPVVDRIACVQ